MLEAIISAAIDILAWSLFILPILFIGYYFGHKDGTKDALSGKEQITVQSTTGTLTCLILEEEPVAWH